MYAIERGTPIYFESKLIGVWDQNLAVEYANFDLTWTQFREYNTPLIKTNAPAINQIHFKVCYTTDPPPQMYLTVDTLNGLRYVKQFLPEDSILSTLPR